MSRIALISVYEKQGIEDFAHELIELGWEIYASGGTARHLTENDVAVKDVADLVGGGAILGHKVVTLSREIHAGLLADQNDTNELKELNIPHIDLVCGDLYPLEQEVAKADATEQSVRAQTDMGGPAMLRSAAKGGRIVISRPEQRQQVIDWLKDGQPEEAAFLRALAADAEATVAHYALVSARYQSEGEASGMTGRRVATAKYGENPWQKTAWLYKNDDSDDALALDRFELTQGAPPSYNNYADFDRLLQTMTHIAAGYEVNSGSVPMIALGAKHGNVCGAAVGDDPRKVIQRMLEGDLRAIFGGVMMLNFAIDEVLAETLVTHKVEKGRRLIDGIITPAVSKEAMAMLQRKGDKCRLLVNPALGSLGRASLDTAPRMRYVRGGWLMQDNYDFVLDLASSDVNGSASLKESVRDDIVLGWAIGSTSNSNTITLVKDSMLIGNGVGQQDRVSAAQLATKRAIDAGHEIKGATAYSDSFFPFPDGPEALAEVGVATIFSSSGSVGDEKVRAACEAKGVALVTIPDAVGRGFYAH